MKHNKPLNKHLNSSNLIILNYENLKQMTCLKQTQQKIRVQPRKNEFQMN